MSQYVLLRIQAIQEELEALKKAVIHQLEGTRNKTQIKGLWREVVITDEDLESSFSRCSSVGRLS